MWAKSRYNILKLYDLLFVSFNFLSMNINYSIVSLFLIQDQLQVHDAMDD